MKNRKNDLTCKAPIERSPSAHSRNTAGPCLPLFRVRFPRTLEFRAARRVRKPSRRHADSVEVTRAPETGTPKPVSGAPRPAISPALGCKHCASRKIYATHVRYGYNLKCRDCEDNTSIDDTCTACGKKARIGNSGQNFDRVCPECGHDERVWVDSPGRGPAPVAPAIRAPAIVLPRVVRGDRVSGLKALLAARRARYTAPCSHAAGAGSGVRRLRKRRTSGCGCQACAPSRATWFPAQAGHCSLT